MRWLLPLAPIAVAVSIVTCWPRPLPLPSSALPGPSTGLAVSTDDAEDLRYEETIRRVQESAVSLEYNAGDLPGKRSVATGVVFSSDGDVSSVRVEPPKGPARDAIVARDSVGHQHPARFVASDPDTGLTLLKITAEDIKPIRPAEHAALLGASVFLIGHPYALGPSVSLGNIAGRDRRAQYGPRAVGGLLQVQVSLHPGDSGALLADRRGGWLGLIRGGLITPDARDDNNLGIAIPAADAVWVAGQLRRAGRVDRAYLGIKLADAMPMDGADVVSVIPGSPAETAGLRAGDRVVKLDDWPIRTTNDLTDRLDLILAGTEVVLEYTRDASVARLTIPTGSRPSETAAAETPSSPPVPAPPPAGSTIARPTSLP